MKIKKLQKRLALEVVISLAILGLVWGGVYMLSNMVEEIQTQERDLDVEIAKITAEKSALQAKYDNTQNNMDVYEEALALHPNDPSGLSKQVIQDRFKPYQQRFSINAPKLTMTTQHDLTEAKYKRNAVVVAASELTMTFETILDENAYSMLNAFQRDLPGILKITYFKLVRSETLTDKALEAIANTGAFPLIKGEVRLSLLGIKPVTPSANAKPNAPKLP